MLLRRIFQKLSLSHRPPSLAKSFSSVGSESVLDAAKRIFKRHPLASSCVVYGGLYAAAEITQQTMNQVFKSRTNSIAVKAVCCDSAGGGGVLDKFKYDIDSVQRYLFIGTCVYSPVFYAWYKWLDSRFRGKAVKVVVTKILLDQFLLGPPSLACFFVLMSYLEGKADVWAECKKKFATTYALDCIFWIPVQAINFALVPKSYRVPFIGAAAFVWLNILCIVKNLDSYMMKSEEEV
jgi:hypothetical protein